MKRGKYARIKLLRGLFITMTNVYLPNGTVDINAELDSVFKDINSWQKERYGLPPFEMYLLDGTFEFCEESEG